MPSRFVSTPGRMSGWVGGGGGKLMNGVGWVESFESAELGLGEWECGVDVSFPFFMCQKGGGVVNEWWLDAERLC